MEIKLLNDILIIFGLSVVVLYLCNRIKIPAVLGFIFTGVLAGPYGFRLLKNIHDVEILAEIGIIFLLFTIGIEFSLSSLLRIKKDVFGGGSLQIILTTLIFYLIARYFGRSNGEAIFLGLLISFSSTAIVLRIIQQKFELETPYGRANLAILIFQDLVTIPLMIITPHFGESFSFTDPKNLYLLIKGLGIIVLIIVLAKWVIPEILYQIARTRMTDLFLLCILALCLGIIWIASLAGISIALGAFLAGLIISESKYSHQALANILPFKDVFTSFTFISFGMLLVIPFVFQKFMLIVFLTALVLILKIITGSLTAYILGYSLRTTLLIGFSLCQIGEFSFILAHNSMKYELLSDDLFQLFVNVTLLTMAISPLIIMLAPKLADLIMKIPFPIKIKTGLKDFQTPKTITKKDHLIIVGFGITGRNIAHAAKAAGIKYIIIETNPDTVLKEQKKGEDIFYGDATHEVVLTHADIMDARIVVVAINDPAATRRIIESIRRMNEKIYIIVRTRFLQEMKSLLKLGANEVIPEEFETSIEIFTRVLTKYLIPKYEIEKFISEIRSNQYDMLRTLSKDKPSLLDLNINLPNVDISYVRIEEKMGLHGMSLSDIDIRNKYQITVIAINRNGTIISEPTASTTIYNNDILIVIGHPDKIKIFSEKSDV